MKTTPKTRTTRAVSFEEALKHGKAQHRTGPWRINLKNGNFKRRFEKGRPEFDDHGMPKLDWDGNVVLVWFPCSKTEALEFWDPENWILE